MISEVLEARFINDKKGRGLFAKKDIPKGTILDNADALLITEKEFKVIENTKIGDYIFEWDEDESNENAFTGALLLSPMELINHSYDPNTRFDLDKPNKLIIFTTIKDIKKGEEITINYNGYEEKPEERVWFKVEE